MRITHRYLGPAGSSGDPPTLPTKSTIIDTTELPPPPPPWRASYFIDPRATLPDLNNPSPARPPSPLDPWDDDLLDDDPESHPVDLATIYIALEVIKSEAPNMLTVSGLIMYMTAPPASNSVTKSLEQYVKCSSTP